MDSLLEEGLELIAQQPGCIKATFTSSQQGAFTVAEDERGAAFLFERFQSPAVFIEVIKTAAGKIRGNHVHQNCNETLHVISGEVELYLLCKEGKHVFKRIMRQGDVVVTPKGTPHALRSLQKSECVVLFDKDPRSDRARVPILKY
ncbi:MAG TPA: cupin domain-containing protein [Candidatus Saccharimonadales bacterium]|nr:cupin domain-containing protein [Candidatus Saccharimonadales bacterium]